VANLEAPSVEPEMYEPQPIVEFPKSESEEQDEDEGEEEEESDKQYEMAICPQIRKVDHNVIQYGHDSQEGSGSEEEGEEEEQSSEAAVPKVEINCEKTDSEKSENGDNSDKSEISDDKENFYRSQSPSSKDSGQYCIYSPSLTISKCASWGGMNNPNFVGLTPGTCHSDLLQGVNFNVCYFLQH
jgi:hypothetical protein